MIVNNLNKTIKIVAESKDDLKKINEVINPSKQVRNSDEYKNSVRTTKEKLKRSAF